eukprot:g1688.t1
MSLAVAAPGLPLVGSSPAACSSCPPGDSTSCSAPPAAQTQTSSQVNPYAKYFAKRHVTFDDASSSEHVGWKIYLSEKYQTLNFSPNQFQPPLPSFQLVDPTRIGEGCFMRAVGAGVMGYGLGIMLGGFMHSMQPVDMSYGHLSTSEQIRMAYKGFGSSCRRMGRNFRNPNLLSILVWKQEVGMVYSTTECLIEKERGGHELINAVYAGCATGGFLAMQSGPMGMLTGCAGFAAFSLAIEQFMGNHA